jgi:hypothetical protein
MPINGAGQLSIGGDVTGESILKELDLPTTSEASLNDAALRGLAEKTSGEISMNNFYGKSDIFNFSIASNLSQTNLRTLAVNAGWNGTSAVVCTLNAGKYITSNSVSVPALTINGSFPSGVQFVNKGFVMGKGGGTSATNGQAGGSAISLGLNVTINQAGGYIGGGGGAGGATSTQTSYGGGGAGAGKGNAGVGGTGGNNQGGRKIPGSGGAGKTTSRSGTNDGNSYAVGSGGQAGGGGSTTTYSTKSTSHTNQGTFVGNCSYSTYYTRRGDAGGGGGGYGASGGRGASSATKSGQSASVTTVSGAGGSNNANGGGASSSGAGAVTYSSGGGGGRAVQKNGKTVTWIGGTGNVYGAVS